MTPHPATPITGLWPALLHPVDAEGVFDTERALAHARRMLEAGADGVTIFGTTGEGPAYTVAERQTFLENLLRSGVQPEQVIVTITAGALGDAIALGRHASGLGVNRVMWMPPYYFNQPRDAGVVAAATQVINGIGNVQLGLLLYHFPAMSSYAFSHAAIEELLRRHPAHVVGLKDSGGDLAHSLALARAFPGFSVLVGTEPHVAPVMCIGGGGSINGLANVAPRLMRRVVTAPQMVSAEDKALMEAILALISIKPGLPFLGVYKTILAEQTGDDLWLNMRAPLSRLEPAEEQAVRAGYRAIGDLLKNV